MSVPKNFKTGILNALIEEQSAEAGSFVLEKTYLNHEIEIQVRLEELKTLQEQNKTLSQNNDERKKYAKCIFALTIVWAALIFVILFMVGKKKLGISDNVVITLISSTPGPCS